MRPLATSILALRFALVAVLGFAALGQDNRPTENQIKAAYLFNFAKFVEWPPNALPATDSPIIIGVLGASELQNDLERIIKNKKIDSRPLLIKEFRFPEPATNCHVLFIGTSERKRLPEILSLLKGVSILTVGEMDEFIASGGMIGFFREGTKLRFQINETAAKSANLKISSHLLSLASQVPR